MPEFPPPMEDEIKLGIRCGCGRRIENGWEYFLRQTAVDQQRNIVQVLTTIRSCGDEKCPGAGIMDDTAIAKRRVEVEWLTEVSDAELELIAAMDAAEAKGP